MRVHFTAIDGDDAFVPGPVSGTGGAIFSASPPEHHDTIITTADFTVPAGTEWDFDYMAIYMEGPDPYGQGEGGSLFNEGKLIVSSDQDAYGIVTPDAGVVFTDKVIQNDGLLQVTGGFDETSQGTPWIDGIFIQSWGPDIWNTSTGVIKVSGYQADAIQDWDSLEPIVNDGRIEVDGNLNATAFDCFNSGFHITNNGTVVVHAADGYGASAYFSLDGGDTIINNGTITVSGDTDSDHATGLGWYTLSFVETIINHGTITAPIAMTTIPYNGYTEGGSNIYNDGVVNGDIDLLSCTATVTNAGQINGNVTLGDNDGDTFTSEHGHVTGIVDGGGGRDTAFCDVSDSTANLVFTVGDTSKDMSLLDGTVVINFESFGIISGSGNDSFTMAGGDDFLEGGPGNDTLNGAGGTDTASYAHATGGVRVDLTISGPQNVGGGAGTDTLISIENLVGSAFDDVLIGNSGKNVIQSGAGNDTLIGGDGDDTFVMGASFNGADTINGGDGNDTIVLDGDYSAGITLSATTLTSVETIVLGDLGHPQSYDITTVDSNVAAGEMLTIDGIYTDIFNFDGSAETDGSFWIIGGTQGGLLIGGAGNDFIRASGQHVTIDASYGGDDTIFGGENYTTIYFGSAFTSADHIQGAGGGSLTDTVVLDGDYSAGVVFTRDTMTLIETLELTAGHSYKFTTADQTVAALATLTVDGSQLGAGETLTVIATAETDGSYDVLGGAGDDVYQAGTGTWAIDTFNGGDGSDTLNFSKAGFGLTIDLTRTIGQNVGENRWETLISVENVVGSAYGDSIRGNASDNSLSGLAGDDVLDLANGGNDTVSGGDGNDMIAFGASLTAGDKIDGGSGIDTLTLNGDYSAGLTFAADTMINVEIVTLEAGHSYNLTLNNANVASGRTLTVDGSALERGNALIFDGSAETDGNFVVSGGAGGDTITVGRGDDVVNANAGNDVINASKGGNDAVSGGNGNDTISFGATLTASDKIDGGSGNDTVVLDGDYSGGLVFGATTMINVETLQLSAGHSYNLTTSDATVAAGATLKVNGKALHGADQLVFDGSAEHDGSFNVIGGKGNDVLTGGDGNDQLSGNAGNDILFGGKGADFLSGGHQHDTFVYTAADQSTSTGFDTISHFSAKADAFDLWFTVDAIDTAVTTGALSLASFDSDLSAALAGMGAHEAIVFDPDSGDFAGKTFLVVDANGVAGYQAGQDLVFELDHASHLNHLKLSSFT